ncbi:hypothetical protein KIN20_029334 [Parelaphostrongylus tenuis]|uniref:Senescence domain-containing protein n=1 Tax=Parelaphostrongylus tenuis TaxID=148309 RepID=A0AAD5R2I3_PARTN|nr:hypothetical protein KIN20_029334 [Parelaphostrongylus tenuis]
MFKYFLRLPDTAAADALFSEAYACLDQGLCYEECNDREHAVTMYERGLNLIEEAEKAKHAKKSELYKHLMDAKPSTVSRLEVLRKEIEQSQGQSKSDSGEKSGDKMKLELRGCLENVGEAEADVLFSIPDGVQLFTIDGDQTTVPTYPTSLQIIRLNTSTETSKLPSTQVDGKLSAMIQVGPWVYPLIGGNTPILHNDFGAYVVPNPTADHPNLAVAILLPADLDAQVVKEFREVLAQYADVRDQDVKKELSDEQRSRVSEKLAQLLITGGEHIAWGVETVAVRVTSYLDEKGERYRAGLDPSGKPLTINPALKGSLVYMHKGSKLVAKCTRYLLDKVGEMGVSIGRSLASGAEKTLGKGSAGGLVTGAISVIGGGVVGVSTVWLALENNSRVLCRSIADQNRSECQNKVWR